MSSDETYELIQHLESQKEKFCDDNNIEGAFWRIKIIVEELDNNFEKPLSRVTSEEL